MRAAYQPSDADMAVTCPRPARDTPHAESDGVYLLMVHERAGDRLAPRSFQGTYSSSEEEVQTLQDSHHSDLRAARVAILSRTEPHLKPHTENEELSRKSGIEKTFHHVFQCK